MKISLLSVPVEPHYLDLMPKIKAGVDAFVSPRSGGHLGVAPKIAVVSLIKWMEKHGYPRETVDFYDVDMELPDDERLARYFRDYQPDVVGLSAVVSTCYYQLRRIAKILRATCPNAWIVAGGSLAASANMILRKTDVDVCVAGDGELAWVEFLDYVKEHGRAWDYEALSKIQGLVFLDEKRHMRWTGYGKSIPAEDMPFPDYDILASGLKDRPEDLKYYFRTGLGAPEFQTDPRSYAKDKRPVLASLWSSKGCVARCTFCQRSTKGYRVPLAQALDEHVAMLKERFNVGFINIIDENFASSREYAYDFARVMKKHDMLWMVSGVRVSSVEREDIQFFREHGCSSMKFGVETGSQKIMNVMEKKFTVERVFQTLKHLADFDMNSPLAVMVGMPGETNETVAETGRFLGRVSHMQGVEPQYQGMSIFYALPLTGTPLYIYGQQIGLIGRTPEAEEDFLLGVSGIGTSKINYVNLNGAPVRDVIFWDWLVKLEATRAFWELEKEKPIDRTRFIYKKMVGDQSVYTRREVSGRPLTIHEVLNRFKAGVPTGIRAKLFYAVDNFLEDHVVYNRFLAERMPRWLVHGFVRWLLYAMHLLQRPVARMDGKDFNLYKKRPHVELLQADGQRGRVDIGSSLRSIVRARGFGAAKDADEAAQDLLAIGL